MQKHSFGIRGLSVFLAILIAVFVVPVSVYADALESIGNDETVENTVEEENTALTRLSAEVFEDTSLREENVKHFRLADGSYIAYAYGMPIHTRGEDGLWQDIDNTLTASGDSYVTPNARVKFAKKITGNEALFTLHDGNRKLTMSLDGAIKKTEGIAVNTETQLDESADLLQKLTTLDKLTSRITYYGILSGVDLEYVVDGVNVKENIIVKEKQDTYTYSFTLALNNLEATLLPDGAVIIEDADTGETVYTVPAPTVFDADGIAAPDGAAYYTLTQSGNKIYTLAVTVSADWMNSADRAFPVTVDPPIISQTGSDTVDLYLSANSPDTPNASELYTYVGPYSCTYWKKTTLPPLPDNAFVVKAVLAGTYAGALGHMGVYAVTSDWSSDLTWNEFHSGTSNAGATGSRAYDYFTLKAGEPALKVFDLDITALVKDWYDGDQGNYGICLKPATGTSFQGTTTINSSNHPNPSYRPYLTVSYRNMGGVESYWSTTSASAGFAGSGSVNMRLGYLTFAFGGLSTTDAILPYTPTLVYNSTSAGVNVSNEGLGTVTGYGWSADFQQRVTKDTYKDVSGTEHTYYVLRDADGSEHAFLLYTDSNGNQNYYDEDGLGLSLIESSGTASHKYSVLSRYGDSYYFDANGDLVQYNDVWGNSRIFKRDANNRVYQVYLKPNGGTQILQLNYAYNSSGLLSSVTYAGSGKQLRFYYSTTYNGTASQSYSGYLRKIELHSSSSSTTALATAEYLYNSSGYMTRVDDSYSKSRLMFYWTTSKVRQIVEYSSESGSFVPGERVNFTYDPNGINKSTLRTSGKDDSPTNSDDLVTHYLFDDLGRTVSTYVTNVAETEVYGSSQTAYTKTEDESVKKNNRITEQSVTGRTQVNHIVNGTFTGGAINGWTFANTSASVASNTDIDTIGSDDKALRLVYNGSTAHSITGMYQAVNLKAGSYTFSATVKLSGSAGNATVRLKVTNSTGSTVIASSNSYTNNSAVGNQAKEIPLSVTVTLAEQATYRYYIEYVTTSTVQTLTVDDIALIQGEEAGLVSLVQNGSFETSSGWTSFSSGATYDTTEKWSGNRSLKLVSTPSSYSFYRQRYTLLTESEKSLYLNNSTSATVPVLSYTLSGYGKSENACLTTLDDEPILFALQAKFRYLKPDGTTVEGELETIPFDPGCSEWQYVSGSIQSDPTVGIPYEIDIFVEFSYNVGEAYFDDIVCTPSGEFVKYEYDNEGNRIQAINDNRVTKYTYTGVDLIQINYSDGRAVTYVYRNHKVTEETYFDNTGTVSKPTVHYDYTAQGLLSYVYSVGLNEDSIMGEEGYSLDRTDYTYYTDTACYGQLNTVITAERTTKYFYSSASEDYGMLRAVIGANGKGTAYTYDFLGRQTTAKPANGSTSSYTAESNTEKADMSYNGADLVSITTDSTVYGFAYNANGAKESISVGGNQIARYLYNGNNGKLRYVVYGNGYVERYDYDTLDRLSNVWYYEGGDIEAANSVIQGYAYTQAAAYRYDAEGNLAEYVDYVTGERELYRYRLDGSVESVTAYTLDGTSIIPSHQSAYTYDSEGRITQAAQCYLLNGSVYTANATVSYDAIGRVSTYEENGITTGYEYLEMGMLRDQTVTSGSLSVQYHYDYEELSDDSLTGRVSGFSSAVKYGTTDKSSSVYTYTYDLAGNITEIKLDGVLKISYAYDNLNQLVRENNAFSGKTYTYTYDNAGNITSKRTYAYTTETVGAAENTYTYAYQNSAWGDQLTAYRGVSFTYDSLGNPLTYSNGSSYTFTWAKGRQLTNVTKGSNSFAFTYDAEGRRTSKVSYGNRTVYYVWDGDRLAGEYVPYESTYIYLYDAEGSVIGFKYKDETGYYTGGAFYTYYYEKNLQGDIVGIIDENGNKFVEYTYDAWGNMLSRTMLGSNLWSLHYNLAESNPFLYRGYYYDRETGFYYLRSRYYDPVTGRFLNADGYVNANGDLIGYNMYAYCSNNPVMYTDPSGEWLIEVLSVIIVVAIVGIACYDAYNTAQTAKTVVESVDTITSIPEEIMTEKHLFAANALVLAKYPNAPIIPINEEAYPDYNQYVRNAAEILKCFPDEKIQKMMHPDYQLTYEDISYVATDCWGYYDSGFRGNMAVKHSKEFYEAAYDLLEIYWGSGTNLAG